MQFRLFPLFICKQNNMPSGGHSKLHSSPQPFKLKLCNPALSQNTAWACHVCSDDISSEASIWLKGGSEGQKSTKPGLATNFQTHFAVIMMSFKTALALLLLAMFSTVAESSWGNGRVHLQILYIFPLLSIIFFQH